MNKHKCDRCGKLVRKEFELCYECFQRQQEQQRWQAWEAARYSLPEDDGASPMCVMCGKEYFTEERKDGKYYCSECWTIWNS